MTAGESFALLDAINKTLVALNFKAVGCESAFHHTDATPRRFHFIRKRPDNRDTPFGRNTCGLRYFVSAHDNRLTGAVFARPSNLSIE